MMSEPKLHWEDPAWLKQASDWIHIETSRQLGCEQAIARYKKEVFDGVYLTH